MSAIPNFRLMQRIGEGGFGEVWLAETITGKRRAVKIVYRRTFERPDIPPERSDELFRIEFEGVRSFEDLASGAPGLITVHHVGQDEEAGFYYYVMPLADDAREDPESGEYEALSLDRRVARDGPLDWHEALDMLRQFASGLSVLHRNGLCHGDVSSPNILYIDGRAVLADPGLTRLGGSSHGCHSPGFSDSHALAGTDHCHDVFGLGRVLYHAVTGLHPADHFPLIPAERMGVLPVEELAELLDRCCDPDPELRFRNAGELLEAIGGTRDTAPTGETPPAGRISKRLAVAAVVMLALVLSGIAWLSRPPTPGFAEIDGNFLTVVAASGGKVLWKKKPGGTLIQADVDDLDEDGRPEVLCAIRHLGNKNGGRLMVFNAKGSLLWQHDTSLAFQNYPRQGDNQMALFGFLAADLDGKPGKELILVARNALDWYPTALQFLDIHGKLTGCYWHPGHIHLENLLLVRETKTSLPLLAFSALNNSYGVPIGELPPGKQKHRTAFGLLDPRQPGDHEAPPGKGKLAGRDQMTRFYRILAPQWADVRSIHTEDEDHDGNNEIVVWCNFGSRTEFTSERINKAGIFRFNGEFLGRRAGDGHVAQLELRTPSDPRLWPNPSRTGD